MKKLAFLMLLGIFGCKSPVETPCGILRCPAEAVSISVLTIDASGKSVKAAYIETLNLRTGFRDINLQEFRNHVKQVTYKYKIFGNPRRFSTTGDAVSVLIRSESGNESTTYFKIAGGECTCDVLKISGPEVIQID
ncbi:MAG TPA: hypothetical protein VF679_10650 [Pedobacter sp.]